MMATEREISTGERLLHARKNRALTLEEKIYLERKGFEQITPGKGITQNEVAALTGISQPSLTFYEQKNRLPLDKNKRILARFYNTSISDLFF